MNKRDNLQTVGHKEALTVISILPLVNAFTYLRRLRKLITNIDISKLFLVLIKHIVFIITLCYLYNICEIETYVSIMLGKFLKNIVYVLF